MTFTVKFNCDNDAFSIDPRPEIVRVLRAIADRVEVGHSIDTYRTILDHEGNDIGRFKLLTE